MIFWQVMNRRGDQKDLRDEKGNASEKGAVMGDVIDGVDLLTGLG